MKKFLYWIPFVGLIWIFLFKDDVLTNNVLLATVFQSLCIAVLFIILI